MELWRYHRESFVRKASGVSEDDARRRLVQSETTLLWLANHLAGTQRHWILGRFAGGDGPPLPPSDTLAAALEACNETWRLVDAVIEQHDFDDLCARLVHGDAEPLNLRWVVIHLLEETARHAGHADIIREILDGSTGR